MHVCVCVCVVYLALLRCFSYLYFSLWMQVVVPQNDLVVFAAPCEQSAVPHLTQCKHAAIMSFNLTSDLKCSCGGEGGCQTDGD